MVVFETCADILSRERHTHMLQLGSNGHVLVKVYQTLACLTATSIRTFICFFRPYYIRCQIVVGAMCI
jgi:hypothetical protein